MTKILNNPRSKKIMPMFMFFVTKKEETAIIIIDIEKSVTTAFVSEMDFILDFTLFFGMMI